MNVKSSNQALTKPLRVEKYLHIKCKNIRINELTIKSELLFK